MKAALVIFSSNISSIGCVVGAIILAYNNIGIWWVFLIAGILLSHTWEPIETSDRKGNAEKSEGKNDGKTNIGQ